MTTKIIYKHCYRYAYPLGVSESDPTLVPDYIEDKNGHILPYVRFTGGSLIALLYDLWIEYFAIIIPEKFLSEFSVS